MTNKSALSEYVPLLDSIKTRIRHAQVRASLAANAEMLGMYWDVGRIVAQQQKIEGWGAAVVPRLAADIRNDLPDVKGFSERNIWRMIRFYQEYPLLIDENPIVPPVAAQLNKIRQQPNCAISDGTIGRKPNFANTVCKIQFCRRNQIASITGKRLFAVLDSSCDANGISRKFFCPTDVPT